MNKPNKMPAGYFGWSLIDGERGHVALKDVLHNLSAKENGNDHQFAKGAIVGVVSMMMASGMSFDDACQCVWQHLPDDCHPKRFPESWMEHFNGKIKKYTPETNVERSNSATADNCNLYYAISEFEDNECGPVSLAQVAVILGSPIEDVLDWAKKDHQAGVIEIIN